MEAAGERLTLSNLNRTPTMRNQKVVPSAGAQALTLIVAPDTSRADGEAIYRAAQEIIGSVYAECTTKPQPRWRFDDIQRDRPVSAVQLFSALSVLAKCSDVPRARYTEAVEQIAALLLGCAPTDDTSLQSVALDEMAADAAADVPQMEVALSGGQDRAKVQRALEVTVRHKLAASRMATRLATELGRSFVRTPSRVAASRSR